MRVKVCIESFTRTRSLSYVEGIYRSKNLKAVDVTVDTSDISWANARGPLISNGPSVFGDQNAREMMGRMMDADKISLGLDYRIESRVEDIK